MRSVDTIDGNKRGLMYDKRSAWCLAAVGTVRRFAGRSKAGGHDGAADQQNGNGRPAERSPGGLSTERLSLYNGSTSLAGTPVFGHRSRAQL